MEYVEKAYYVTKNSEGAIVSFHQKNSDWGKNKENVLKITYEEYIELTTTIEVVNSNILTPVLERKLEYQKLETSGEAQAALWEALNILWADGVDLGPKASKILDKRSDIKKRIPK